jgi:hypothetical protein
VIEKEKIIHGLNSISTYRLGGGGKRGEKGGGKWGKNIEEGVKRKG